MHSRCMGFGNCNFKEVLTFRIKRARQDKSPFLVQILNIQKSVSGLHILPTLFWCCIDIVPDRTCLDACLIGFIHSQSVVDPFGDKKDIGSIFPSIGHSSAVNNVIQAGLILVVKIIDGFGLLGAFLKVVYKLFVEAALSTVAWEVSVDWCQFRNIPFCWLVLESGSGCCSSAVAWSG